MGTILTETEGFTPVIDVLAQELGLMTAVVYGIAWRYCQMKDRVCSASRETIAKHAGISIKTVERHLNKLCKAGYLKDLYPDRKHRPHVYIDTGKFKIEGLLKVKRGETESLTSESGETESLEGKTESLTRSDTESNQGKTESLIRIPSYDSIHESKKGEKESDFPKKPNADPTLLELERKTAAEREKAGGNHAVPPSAGGGDAAAEVALSTLYTARGSEPPLPESRTYKLELEKVSQVLRDNGVIAPDISRLAAQLMCQANEKSPKFVNPHYRSFPSSFSYHLGVAKNRASIAVARRVRTITATEASLAALDDRRSARPPPPPDDRVGTMVKTVLEPQMGRNAFQQYVAPTCFTCDDGVLMIAAPDEDIRNWLEDHLGLTIKRTLAGVADGPQEVVFEVGR